jgi:alpha-tubulin suppressor-like RCC1 family protein
VGGPAHSLGLALENGNYQVYCWGQSLFGECGVSNNQQVTPISVCGFSTATTPYIAAGANTTICAGTAPGFAQAYWTSGDNNYGEQNTGGFDNGVHGIKLSWGPPGTITGVAAGGETLVATYTGSDGSHFIGIGNNDQDPLAYPSIDGPKFAGWRDMGPNGKAVDSGAIVPAMGSAGEASYYVSTSGNDVFSVGTNQHFELGNGTLGTNSSSWVVSGW